MWSATPSHAPTYAPAPAHTASAPNPVHTTNLKNFYISEANRYILFYNKNSLQLINQEKVDFSL